MPTKQSMKDKLDKLPKVNPEKLKTACQKNGKIAPVNTKKYKLFKEMHTDGSVNMDLTLRFYPITDLSHANNFDTFVVLDGNDISAYPRIAWTSDNGKSWYMTACNDYPIHSPIAYAKIDTMQFAKLGAQMFDKMYLKKETGKKRRNADKENT